MRWSSLRACSTQARRSAQDRSLVLLQGPELNETAETCLEYELAFIIGQEGVQVPLHAFVRTGSLSHCCQRGNHAVQDTQIKLE